MSRHEGADERRVRQLLRHRGVGPDALPPPAREPDWLDRLMAEPEGQPDVEKTPPAAPWSVRTDVAETPHHPAVQVTVAPTVAEPAAEDLAPRDHVTGLIRHALPAISTERLLTVAYNASAAWAGWMAGIVPWLSGRIAHYGADHTPRGVWVGIALVLLCSLAELRTHHLRGPGRHPWLRLGGWITRIPLASAVLALALYTAPL